MKKNLLLLAGLLACLAGPAAAARTDLFQVENRDGDQVRISSHGAIIQSGTIGANNAVQSSDVTGTLSVSSTATFSDALRLLGEKISVPTAFTIGVGTTVTPTSEFSVFNSTGGAITWTATPSLSTTTASNGQLFEIMSSTTSDITLKDNDSTAGTLLELLLNSTTRVLANPGDVSAFRYYDGKWYEVYVSTH